MSTQIITSVAPRKFQFNEKLWKEQVGSYLEEDNTLIKTEADCRLKEIKFYSDEIRFYVSSAEIKPLSFIKIQEEVKSRFPKCSFFLHDTSDLKNESRPYSSPRYYISIPWEAQERLNKSVKMNDLFWTSFFQKSTWFLILGLFLFFVLIFYFLKHTKNLKTNLW